MAPQLHLEICFHPHMCHFVIMCLWHQSSTVLLGSYLRILPSLLFSLHISSLRGFISIYSSITAIDNGGPQISVSI